MGKTQVKPWTAKDDTRSLTTPGAKAYKAFEKQ